MCDRGPADWPGLAYDPFMEAQGEARRLGLESSPSSAQGACNATADGTLQTLNELSWTALARRREEATRLRRHRQRPCFPYIGPVGLPPRQERYEIFRVHPACSIRAGGVANAAKQGAVWLGGVVDLRLMK